jgi:HlyD family secretion protein
VQNVVTYDVVSEAPNPQLLLKPGMTAAVRIVSEHRDSVIRVPAPALRYVPAAASADERIRAATSAHVWLLRDGTPVLALVKIGLGDDANTEIVSGQVQPGDQIIVGEHSTGASTAPGLGRQAPPRAPRL